ncbi:MAG TPA: carboxymuconolactone decarboxylase family protein [Nitrososphaerales archaeon]|nr:carboxymuconolactone decarboxylase family protein [Nitrososphaerales archaeon]
MNYKKVSPDVADVMKKAGDYLDKCGLEDSLQELVRIRASQMNGCAQCLDMHTKDARADGETEQRLNLIAAWREAPLYTERERAALEWTETVTRIDLGRVPDQVYESARKQFTEKELVDLTLAVVAINGYNRLNIAFRTVAGGYKPLSGKS